MLKFLGENPVLKNKNLLGLSLDDQRDLLFRQLKEVAFSGIYNYKEALDEPLK